jgi:hypothetical protein
LFATEVAAIDVIHYMGDAVVKTQIENINTLA